MELTLEEQTLLGASRSGARPGLKPLPSRLSPGNITSLRPLLRLLVAVLFLLAPVELLAAIPRLSAPPEGERWFSINLDGERVGFARLSIAKAGDGYRIDSEGSVKLRVMGFSREAITKEWYLVGRDLTLRSFASESRIDGSPMAVKGEVTANGVKVAVETAGKSKERILKTRGALYPPHALNLYPLMQGTQPGKSNRINIVDLEAVKVKPVKVEVVGEETLADGTRAVHLRNDLYPMVDNDVWVDLEGNSIRESVRDDLVVTLAEDEGSARSHLADAALSKRDMVLDFSMVRIEPAIERPEQLKKLVLELGGVPADLPVPQGPGQQVTRLPDGKLLFTMPNPGFAPPPGEAPGAADLEPGPRIPSDAAEIVALKEQIAGAEQEPARKARLLVQWVAQEIKGTVTDSHSPLETLRSRAGNCQSHARLYTALARAAGIPTRFVSGLVYSGPGLLYHSWAESYLNGGWVAVDPTFGEMPANLTHIKLVQGDSSDELGALAGMIGRVKARVVEKQY